MIVKLLTEHNVEFLSLKSGCRGLSESTHVKMPHCWKSHATAQIISISWRYFRKMSQNQQIKCPFLHLNLFPENLDWSLDKEHLHRAYPGSESVVANTLAKWTKLEPNEINFSQGFGQKVVSTSCFVFNSLPARGDFCCLLISFANSLDPDHFVGPDLDPNYLTP